MTAPSVSRTSTLGELIRTHEPALLEEWEPQLRSLARRRPGGMSDGELQDEARAFLRALATGTRASSLTNLDDPAWRDAIDLLSGISRSRAQQGYTPGETALFVLSLKRPLFTRLRDTYRDDTAALGDEIWNATELLDRLALVTTDAFIRGRDEVIRSQQQEMLELSTPVIQLWQGVLALPLIGTLDSSRTQVVMESLLQAIVDSGSAIAIIDITGVPTVDTLVAQHLLKTVAAARLMGADCIISGIRPQIAQTIVHLGVELPDVITKSTLADALAVALERNGLAVSARSRA